MCGMHQHPTYQQTEIHSHETSDSFQGEDKINANFQGMGWDKSRSTLAWVGIPPLHLYSQLRY